MIDSERRREDMLTDDIDHVGNSEDLDRRRQLRSFLMQCRTRLAPMELGLPRTSRRRVQGLRRGEVAELIGVTDYWYRAFESGRPVRVSTQFVARLANALRLTPAQQMTLFRLSFPEIYRLLRT
jgi:helix-turn-helix protein